MIKEISGDIPIGELNNLLGRKKINDTGIVRVVTNIINDVRKRGDESLLEQAEKFDGADLYSLAISADEFDEARKKVSDKFVNSLRVSIERVKKFHKEEMIKSWSVEEEGCVLGETIIPLENVGCYVPGGLAAYPSSVVMTVVPAKVAGVKNIIVCTPCNDKGMVNPYTLVACLETGCTDVFKIGGAGAIAAMAYGTKTIKKVDKIIGPGNIYVAVAKRIVFGDVGIDSIAGPSEVVVIADENANAKFIALDMLAQAEHGSGANAVLITYSKDIAKKVINEVENLEKKIPDNLIFLKVGSLDDAFTLSNRIAPEHLEIFTDKPFEKIDKVKNAGAILLGEYTPASFGDYLAGPNHVLPTGGAARFSSALSVRDFVKFASLLYCSKDTLKNLAEDIDTIASAEGLKAHARAATERIT